MLQLSIALSYPCSCAVHERNGWHAAGATDAARGAADIVLTRPGLSVIVSAIIGARKIFQRMTTYSKYTVAMTFRVCFTFGLLTVIYNWCATSCILHGSF